MPQAAARGAAAPGGAGPRLLRCQHLESEGEAGLLFLLLLHILQHRESEGEAGGGAERERERAPGQPSHAAPEVPAEVSVHLYCTEQYR